MSDGESQLPSIDEALAEWRQGDCATPPIGFVYRTDPPTSPETGSSEDDLVEEDAVGFVILTQTCDIVRSHRERPFLTIAPLTAVDNPNILREVEKARRPRYVFVRGVAEHGLVADLDKIMTVEKSVVASWTRIKGCKTEDDDRRLRQAISRKFQRTPFPDDFNLLVEPLSSRLEQKHGKSSPEGEALRSLHEIRVHAAPGWGAKAVDLHFWFIRDPEPLEFDGRDWSEWLGDWLGRLATAGRFVKIDGTVVTHADLSALDYILSDPLDLDHLSGAQTTP